MAGRKQKRLPFFLIGTLKAVQSGLRTPREILQADPDRNVLVPTAIVNRLERLREMGLVTREPSGYGRIFHYSATAKAKGLNPTPKGTNASRGQ